MSSFNYISQLSALSSFADDDLLVVAQQDKYVHDNFTTRSIDWNTLVKVMFSQLLKTYQFGSAAYEESSVFSKYNHVHDDLYNNISLDFAYQLSDDNVLSIGNVFIDGALIPLCMPLSSSSSAAQRIDEPYVGALKFVALTSISSNSSIQYKSAGFDGWLYPDGSSFMLSDFSLSNMLNELYGNGSYVSFTLPNINKFIKLSNASNPEFSNNQISSIPGHTTLKVHTHNVDLNSNVSATIDLAFPACKYQYNGGLIMSGCGVIYVRFYCARNLLVTYEGQQMKLSELVSKLQNDRYQSTKLVQVAQSGSYNYIYAYLHVDDFETICKAIDDTYPNANTYENVFQNLMFDLPQINNIIMKDTRFSIDSDVSMAYASSGEDDETYPTHVTLPVMIYVGKRQ